MSSERIWRELHGGELEAELEPIAARLGEEGIPFREGAQMIEMIAQGPVQPEALARAGSGGPEARAGPGLSLRSRG
jgi:hypothetical protein